MENTTRRGLGIISSGPGSVGTGLPPACGSQIKVEGRPTRESAVESVKARLQARDLMGDAENHLDEAKRLQKELE